jgi:macrolide-specific efflux system membrane fusion protein
LKPIIKWIFVALVLILAVVLGTKALKSKKAGKAVSYKASQVTRGPVSSTIKSTGNVQPQNRLEVNPPVAGRVEKVLVVEGQYVKKGQTLALISSSERAALLDAARAKGAAEVAHWEDIYKATPLLAPMSGQVINREVEPGQAISTSSVVVVLSDHLIVDGEVDETDIGRIKVGQKATLTLDAYADQIIQARVSQIRYEAKTVNNVTMYEVYVLPVKVPTFMRSGMTANVEFIVGAQDDALLVSTDALTTENGKTTVLVPGGPGERPRSVVVETGLTNGTQTQIKSGLSEGATVLTKSFSTASLSAESSSNPFMPKMGSGKKSTSKSSGGQGGPPAM